MDRLEVKEIKEPISLTRELALEMPDGSTVTLRATATKRWDAVPSPQYTWYFEFADSKITPLTTDLSRGSLPRADGLKGYKPWVIKRGVQDGLQLMKLDPFINHLSFEIRRDGMSAPSTR